MARSTDVAPARSIVSDIDRRRPGVRFALGGVQIVILIGLIVAGLGPLLWLLKAALSTSQDILRDPFGFFPSGVQWDNLLEAWNTLRIGPLLFNTAVIAAGSAIVTLFVCTTVAYVLSVLRPAWGPILSGAILATLFIPAIVVLVPLYLTILDLPITGGSLANNYLALWLPAAANAFNILVVKRFFDTIPRDLYEAARMDGAGPVRVFFSIVLPLSRPILGVIGLLAIIASWKDFLWPFLVIQDSELQPISVALPLLTRRAELELQMAALFLAVIIPVALFLVFQRQVLRGVGAAGGIKE